MSKPITFLAVLSIVSASAFVAAVEPAVKSAKDAVTVSPADWPWWRGPTHNGVAPAGQQPPLKWSATENVVWKAPVPGRGHGSPTVVGDQIFLATSDVERDLQSLLCFDRLSGKLLWETPIHKGGLNKGGNGKATLASSTPACDGTRVFINFMNDNAIYTTALDRAGKQLWQTKVTDYVLHQGFGSSPAIYQSLALVSADNKGKGVLAGLDRATGEIVWKRERPKTPNYASPIPLTVAGKEQLLFIGCDLVTSLEPLTGNTIWEIPGSTTECVTSTVTDGKHIYTSGGYPKNHVSAVLADGSGKVVWENKSRIYVPSMLVSGGHLYGVQDSGVAVCWKSDTGAELWKGRIDGTFSASPVLVGDLVYATNEAGRTYIFKADPAKFELVAENQLGDSVFASPAICGNRIYQRVAHQKGGQRQEMLYCLGK